MLKVILIASQYTEQVSINNKIKSMKVKQQSGEKSVAFCNVVMVKISLH